MNSNLVKSFCSLSLFAISIPLALHFGSTEFGLADLFDTFDSSNNNTIVQTVLINIRLPRILVGCLVGGSLAAAGVISQGLFQNPLASPSVIGTTAGGSVAAALMFYLGSGAFHWLSLPLAAFAGSIISTSIILMLSNAKKMHSVETLLLAGFALNALFGAVTSFILTLLLSDFQKFPALMFWMMGGLDAKGWWHLNILWPTVSLGLILAWRIAPKLDVLALGTDVASTLNVNIGYLRLVSIVTIAILVGAAVSVAGAISFVGLVIPHITRIQFGPHHKKLLFYSFINGSTLVVFSDIAARTLWSPQEVQVGILISIIGSVFFFWLLFNRHRFSRGS